MSKRPAYYISWLKNTYVEIENSKTKSIKSFFEGWVDYSGPVYCVNVKNHIIYIRRHGKGCWCGNSLRWYDNGAPEEVNKIIAKYEYISERTCVNCGKTADGLTRGYILPYCKDCHDINDMDLYYTEDMPFYGHYKITSNKDSSVN